MTWNSGRSQRAIGVAKSRTNRGKLNLAMVRFLNSSAGQVLLAEAIVLAAGVLGARKRGSPAASGRGQGTRVTIEDALTRLSYAGFVAMKAFRVALSESARVTARPAAAMSAKPVLQLSLDKGGPIAKKRSGAGGGKRPRARTNRTVTRRYPKK